MNANFRHPIEIGRPRRRPRAWRSGVALVEFAIILPVLITIVLGCVDFGRFAYTYIAVTNAARVGAGLASCKPYSTDARPQWEAEIRAAVAGELQGMPGFDPARLTIAAPVLSRDSQSMLKVRVEV